MFFGLFLVSSEALIATFFEACNEVPDAGEKALCDIVSVYALYVENAPLCSDILADLTF
jgi:hypothetical protein